MGKSVLEQVRQQIDLDFGRVASTPAEPTTPSEPEAVFSERYIDYRGEPRDWLRTLPEPVQDTKIVAFSRVSRSLDYSGMRINRTPKKPIPDGVDADDFVQAYIDECGLAAEAYNASGQVVRKYTTQSETLSFL